MTPQEKAVIEAAIRWSRTETVGQAEDAGEALQDAVGDLLASRTCTCTRTERVYCHATDCHGGADVAEWTPGESELPVHAGADGSCPDYGSTLDPCPPGCASGTCVAGALGKVEESYRAEVLKQEWVPATLIDCLAGDHIRMGTEETDVLRCSAGIWHADNSDAWHPRAWRHTELRMELAAVPGFIAYRPNTPVEILMTPERKAVLTMQSAFPGSAVISSDVD